MATVKQFQAEIQATLEDHENQFKVKETELDR